MPLLQREPPSASRSALADGLPAVVRISRHFTLAVIETQPSVSEPHPAFAMTATAVSKGVTPAIGALPIGWRYLVARGDELAVVTIREDLESGQHYFAEYNVGRFSAATPNVIRNAKRFAASEEADYEMRFLSVPAIHIATIWLKHAEGVADRFIPFGPGNDSLASGRVYGVREFMDILALVAMASIEMQLRASDER